MPQETAVELLHFTWSVPDRGYVWRDDMEAEGILGGNDQPPFLMAHPQSRVEKRYPPLPFDEDGGEDLPLFQRLADLELSQEKIKAFADRWGWLGVGIPLVPSAPRKKEARIERGESLERWRHEIQDIRCAVTLWKWITHKDSTVQVTRNSDHCVTVRIGNATSKSNSKQKTIREIFLFREFLPDLFQRFKQNDPTLPAKTALVLMINKKLDGIASLCLLLNRQGTPQGFVRPHNLLAAIWVQLHQAVQGQRRIVACKHCHELMDVTGQRASKVTHERCAHNAKMKRYRKKLAGTA